MKRIGLLILFVIGLYAGPVQAQGIKLGTQSIVALKVEQQILHNGVPSVLTLAQIINFSGKPLIQIQLPKDQISPVDHLQKVRILDWQTTTKYLLPEGREGHVAYIPGSWKEDPKASAWYRGMTFMNLRDLENLLHKGMELSKVSPRYPGVFATYYPDLALKYAVPCGSLAPVMPVMVKVPAVFELSKEKDPDGRIDFMRIFHRDIAPSFIADVMVFLEVNGKPDWYKVILVNNRMVFIPAFGVIINQ